MCVWCYYIMLWSEFKLPRILMVNGSINKSNTHASCLMSASWHMLFEVS